MPAYIFLVLHTLLSCPDCIVLWNGYKVWGHAKNLSLIHIYFDAAKAAFEAYLDEYDRADDKIHLKIVHTYGVVDVYKRQVPFQYWISLTHQKERSTKGYR